MRVLFEAECFPIKSRRKKIKSELNQDKAKLNQVSLIIGYWGSFMGAANCPLISCYNSTKNETMERIKLLNSWCSSKNLLLGYLSFQLFQEVVENRRSD